MIYIDILTKHRNFRVISVFIFFVVLISSAISVMAYQDGITGITSESSNGCYCHNSNSNSNTSVVINGSTEDFTVAPNSSNDYSITVTNNESTITHTGVNIAVKTTETGNTNAGTLSVSSGSDLQVSSGEITHSEPNALSSGSKTLNFTWDAPSNPGVYYIRAVANAVNGNSSPDNGDMWNRMSVKQVTVYGLTVESPGSSDSYCPGGTVNITWSEIGANNVKIELSSDGGNTYDNVLNPSIAGSEESWTWNIPNDIAANDQYKIKITDTENSDITDEMDGTFSISGSIEITSQPSDIEVCSGDEVSFTVETSGGSVDYQWLKNGNNIGGETSATLTINNVSSNDAAEYSCLVSGTCGDPVESNVAVLMVNQSPGIVSDPEGAGLCAGENFTLTVVAEGDSVEYQWKKDDIAIDGANASSLDLTDIDESDAGDYTCTVTGSCPGEVTSDNARIIVYSEVSISQEPVDTEVCEGGTIILEVDADGSIDDYKWFKDGSMLQGASGATLEITDATQDDAGEYHVLVNGQCNEVESDAVDVVVNPMPEITANPQNKTVTEGESVSFNFESEGNATDYQWRKNGEPVNGETTSSLTIDAVTMDDAGDYDVVITNQCGSDTSEVATLTVEDAGPGAVLSISQSTIDYEMLILNNDTESDHMVTITNTGNEALEITAISISGQDSDSYGIDSIPLPQTLAADGGELILNVNFVPDSPGKKTAEIIFTSNANNNPNIALSGFAASIEVAFSPESYDYGEKLEAEPISQEVKLQNNSNIEINILGMNASGDTSAFSLTEDDLPSSIPAGEDVIIDVTFLSLENGNYNSKYELTIDNLDEPVSFGLSGSVNISSVASIFSDSDLKVFPNPSSEDIQIRLNTEGELINNLEIKIIDYTGKLIRKFNNINSVENGFELNWDTKNTKGNLVSNGTYYIIVKINDRTETLPVILER